MALCGMCKKSRMGDTSCSEGFELKYPLLVTDHNCPKYEYSPVGAVVAQTPFNVPEHDYCPDCTHHFEGVCSGKKWIPAKTEPRCEFFISKEVTCVNAVPCLQYGNGIRNNHCKIAGTPGCDAPSGWSCYNGNVANSKSCYKPKGSAA